MQRRRERRLLQRTRSSQKNQGRIMATDEEASNEELAISTYPKDGKVADEDLTEHFPDPPANFDRPHDGETIRRLRELGVAVIRASYTGGHDEAFYHLEGLFDEDGNRLEEEEDVKSFLDNIHQFSGPEVIAVDEAHGGHFSGAGIGQEYGGTVEMRLDTLETREISTYAERRVRESHESAEWERGRSTVY